MRDLFSSLLGVPATILIAAGVGIMGVTVFSRVRPNPPGPPVRWAHLLLGAGITGIGALLIRLDVALFVAR